MNLPRIEPIKWTGTDKTKAEPVIVINEAPIITPEPIRAQEPELLEKVEQLPGAWDATIKELENFFNSITLPTEAIKLNSFTTINDVPFFIKTNLFTVKAQNGKKTYLPYLGRLLELKQWLN